MERPHARDATALSLYPAARGEQADIQVDPACGETGAGRHGVQEALGFARSSRFGKRVALRLRAMRYREGHCRPGGCVGFHARNDPDRDNRERVYRGPGVLEGGGRAVPQERFPGLDG